MKSLFVTLLLVSNIASASTWFVDRACAGVGDGKSWETAWNIFDRIDWTVVKPGDDVQIAGGDYSATRLIVGASGTEAAPIVVRMAQDQNHKGPVHVMAINVGSRDWVTVDGGLDPDFIVPKSVHDLGQITNNIGFYANNNFTHGIYSTGGEGQRLLWVDIYHCGTASNSENENGVRLNGTPGVTELAYLNIHDQVFGDGINVVSVKRYNVFGEIKIHHCIIDNVGDDALQFPGSTDVYCCKITRRTRGQSDGHTDAFQTWGNNVRIHHNIIEDFQVSAGNYASWALSRFSFPVDGDFLLYNNLFSNPTKPGSVGFVLTFDAWRSPTKNYPNVVITNVFIANNLFTATNYSAIGFTIHYDTGDERGTIDHTQFKNCFFLNNILLDMHRQYYKVAGFSIPGPGTRSEISYESFPMDGNIVAGPNWNFWYMGTQWTNANALALGTPFLNNQQLRPAFENYTLGKPPYDFHPKSNDVVAIHHGVSLDRFIGEIPMIDVDLDGNKRGIEGYWDVGPYEFLHSPPPEPPDECETIRQRLNEALETIRILQSK